MRKFTKKAIAFLLLTFYVGLEAPVIYHKLSLVSHVLLSAHLKSFSTDVLELNKRTFVCSTKVRFGAGGGGRTRTVSLPLDFESSTSANSITPALLWYYSIFI